MQWVARYRAYFSGLIAREFVLASGGRRYFTFPYISHSQWYRLTVTVIPTIYPGRFGLPRYVSNYLRKVTFKEIKRYYEITAVDETI